MTGAAKQKGDRAEREVAALLADLLGVEAKRALGAGRAEDVGDIFGIPDTVIQVADWTNLGAAASQKPGECERQQVHAGATFGASFLRIRGGRWVVALTPDQFATLWREATAAAGDGGNG